VEFHISIPAHSPVRSSELSDFMSKPHWHVLGTIHIVCLRSEHYLALTESVESGPMALQLERERLSSEKQV
jgi:hypothetical protein